MKGIYQCKSQAILHILVLSPSSPDQNTYHEVIGWAEFWSEMWCVKAGSCVSCTPTLAISDWLKLFVLYLNKVMLIVMNLDRWEGLGNNPFLFSLLLCIIAVNKSGDFLKCALCIAAVLRQEDSMSV